MKHLIYGSIYLFIGLILGLLVLSVFRSSSNGHTQVIPQGSAPLELTSAETASGAETVPEPEPAAPISPERIELLPSAPPLSLSPQQGGYDNFTPEEKVNIRVYENTNRSVANINTRSVRRDWYVEATSEGEGSGSVLSKDGYILTNFHVIAGATEITVTLYNGKTYSALVKGVDPSNDIAVLQIGAKEKELYPVVLGNSAELKVGQRIFAIGNPFGLERTLTVGIISSLNRSLPSRKQMRTIKQVIQIDAAINPGNSGGPLMDSRGYMVGMNTAIASRTGQSAGVGFAIPSNTISRVVPQLIKHGRVIVPNIGIEAAFPTDVGLLITQLEENGPAQKAGLRGPRIIVQKKRIGNMVGNVRMLDRAYADTIVSVDGKKIKNGDDFMTIIESRNPGDTVVLGLIRNGKMLELPVKLEGAPGQQEE